MALKDVDPEVYQAIRDDLARQQDGLQLIASENYASMEVLEATGSILTNKYAEGYPGRRYYGGCQFVDVVENLAIERCKKVFGCDHANVQPHSGSQANMAVYFAVLQPGDTILGMDLSHGGHLTHGHIASFSGKLYQSDFYQVDRDTEMLDYDAVLEKARDVKPQMIVCGASAYPRTIDFKAFADIAADVGACLMADIAHIAGLVAAGVHPSPVPHCDFVTSTTHKTLRGPRGAIALCKEEYAKKLDSAVFPGVQGGPFMHLIAGKATCFQEALTEDYREHQRQIVKNAAALADAIMKAGWRLVSGGTDTHLMLVDVSEKGLTGAQAEEALGEAGITLNKNTIPFDTQKPNVASGIRIGTPYITNRGMVEEDMATVADLICRVLENPDDDTVKAQVKKDVKELCDRFPIYEDL